VQTRKREAKQTGVTDSKTYNWQRSVVDICWLMQGEVYLLGRGKSTIGEQSRERERTDSDENQHRSHGNILLDREEESAREREGNNREQTRKREAKQTGVTDSKTYNWQRSVVDICWLMQGEVYLLGRGRKGTIREQSRKRERTV
jgi:bacteriorhodopsin